MRIIGGSARGRILKVPAGPSIRPTANRVRESLFDILGERVVDSVFLDAFAGTGAVGIEALSRGARRAVFLERAAPVIDCLRENLRRSGFTERAEVRRGDAIRSMSRLEREGAVFGLAFLDPPYGSEGEERVLIRVGASPFLDRDAWVILEHASRREPAPSVGELIRFRTSRYGDTTLSLFRRGDGTLGSGGEP